MKTHLCLLLTALCWTMGSTESKSQEVNTKWGKPTQEELTMTEYAPDKDAEAVELYRSVDVNYAYINDDFRIIHRVKCRLKVLKPEGREVADVSFPLRVSQTGSNTREMVMGLKAVAYNMEGGKLVKTKMESDMVNTEQVDKTEKVMKFSVPQVRVGTVIEYEYRIESDFYYDLRDWYAQGDIPVRYTRYSLSVPEWFKYNIEETGMVRMSRKDDFGNIKLGNAMLATKETTFTAENLPALKDDDFVWCARDYGCKVTHELMGIYVPGAVYKNYSSKWEDIDKILHEDSEFGGRIRRSSPLKDEITAAGIPAIADPQQRAEAVWKLLKKHVHWNGNYKFWAKSGSKTLKEGTGSNADINFLYINMLHDAGMEAYPVVLRLRSQGHLPLTHASLKYLSTFVVGIQLNDSTQAYMDGSAEDGYLNVLPSKLLVERARTFRKGQKGEWVDLRQLTPSREVTNIQATISAKGLISGRRIRSLMGQPVVSLRKLWRTSKDSLETIQKMQEEGSMEIGDYKMEGRNDFSPKMRELVTFTKQCDVAGDLIYLNPLVFTPMSKSPFTAETRELPVEFPFSQHEQINVQLTLSEGWQAEELPKPITLKLDGMTARIICMQSGQTLTARYQLDITRTFFGQQQYADLKVFLDKLVEMNKHIVTLKKTS